METSTFPQNFKKAHIRPLLKKKSLHKNELKNYSPVSKMNFISKILEKVVANLIHYNQPTLNIILQNQRY